MSLRFTHETLTSFAVSAMLTSAFLAPAPNGTSTAASGPQPQAIMNALNGLRASGWAGTQDIPAPNAVAAPQAAASASAVSAPEPILTAAQQKALVTLMATYGHDIALNSGITAALGITKGNDVLTLRQLGVNAHPFGHIYIPLPDGGFMLIFNNRVAPASYRLDANLKLIAAVSKNGNEAPVVIPVPDAERSVHTELTFWADVADNP